MPDSDKLKKMISKLSEKAKDVADPKNQEKIRTKLKDLQNELGELIEHLEESREVKPTEHESCSAPVPRTGQTCCWNSQYHETRCDAPDAPPGQDGAHQSGIPWPRPRFSDNRDGTVTDELTGLIWLKDADSFGEVTWDQARMLAAKLESGTLGLADDSEQGDWRLPTIRELFSMVDYGRVDPIVPADYPARETVKSAIYWSSTTLLADPSQAWMMTLGIGPTVFIIKSTTNRMWPVRNRKRTTVPATGQTQTFGFEQTGQDGAIGNRWGVPWPTQRFIPDENGKGTVTDTLTGLVWLKNANPFGWVSWVEALEKCSNLCQGNKGLEDGSKKGKWRLPNVREMESLVDYGRVGPCMPDGWRDAFEPDPNTPIGSTLRPSSYWTSTTVVGAPSQAMFIILGVGPVIFENKEHPFFVLPVRNRI
jgi:hypothetical protein